MKTVAEEYLNKKSVSGLVGRGCSTGVVQISEHPDSVFVKPDTPQQQVLIIWWGWISNFKLQFLAHKPFSSTVVDHNYCKRLQTI